MSRLLGHLYFLLALWVQILAPVAAVQAVTVAGDPLAGMTICGHSLADLTDGTAGADDRQAKAVPLCGLCCAAIAVLEPPPPDAAGVALAWTMLVFMAPLDGHPISVAPYVPRARDPPALA